MSTPAVESDLERTVREEDEQHREDELAERRDRVEGTQSGEDADKGKLFEVPRVAITVDDADPSVIKLASRGGQGRLRAGIAESTRGVT